MPWGPDHGLFPLLTPDSEIFKNQQNGGDYHPKPRPSEIVDDMRGDAFPRHIVGKAISYERFVKFEDFYKDNNFQDSQGRNRIFKFHPWEKEHIWRKATEEAEAQADADFAADFAACWKWSISQAGYDHGHLTSVQHSRFVSAPTQAVELMAAGQQPMLYLLPVPYPTTLYVARAMASRYDLNESRKLLVVLDLNGTLLVRVNDKAKYMGRPGLDQFLEYLFQNHKVAIWSSAKPRNVATMVDTLLAGKPAWKEQLVAIWSRDNLRLGEHYNHRVQIYKQLSWLWADPKVQKTCPEKGRWDQGNTVLIDDNFLKAQSEPHNLIKIDEYTVESVTSGRRDDTLLAVANYLEGLKWVVDASTALYRVPFVCTPMGDTWSCTWDDVGVHSGSKAKQGHADLQKEQHVEQ